MLHANSAKLRMHCGIRTSHQIQKANRKIISIKEESLVTSLTVIRETSSVG